MALSCEMCRIKMNLLRGLCASLSENYKSLASGVTVLFDIGLCMIYLHLGFQLIDTNTTSFTSLIDEMKSSLELVRPLILLNLHKSIKSP